VLQHLKESELLKIIAAAERNNAAHPSSERGITLADGLDLLDRPDPEGDALEQAIGSLSREARLELTALMWLGRDDGDPDADDFATNLDHAKRNSDDGDVVYITEKSPALPTYLRAGLARLRVQV
jgi:hypothetical protein